MLDQKPPLQHLLDQQPKPSHRRAAVPPAPAAAPPPPLHVDQHRSPSCCHPTTHLRQAETCLELPTTVQQPLLHPPSLHSATKLVSCEEKNLGIEGDSKVLNQVDLQLNEKKLVDEEVRAIEVNKIDEDDGLHDSSKVALLDEKHGVEEDRVVSPADHQVSASKEIYWSCSSDVTNILSTAPLPAAALLSDVDGHFKCLLQGLLQLGLHVQVAKVCKWRRSPFDGHISPPMLIFYGGDEGRSFVRYAFDPGGDVSPKLLLSTLVVGSWFPP